MVSFCWAQAPATQPAVVVPEGFARIDAAQRSVIAPAGDAAAAQAVLEAIQGPELPSTMPTDLLARLASHREQITTRIQQDLLMTDQQAIDTFFDSALLPVVTAYDQANPPIAYFWCSREQLRTVIKGGWSNPRFYYNRAADQVMINSHFDLAVDRPAQESLLPALYDEGATDAQRRETLESAIREAEQSIANELASRAQIQVHLEFARFIDNELKELLSRPDQAWLRLGLSGALGAEYAAMATGNQPLVFIRVVAHEGRRPPVRAAGVDLLNPTNLSDLREEMVGPYLDAMRRKSTVIVYNWLTQAGPDAAAKTLQAIRDRKPEDGKALVALIQELTGKDLTKELRPF